MRWVLMVTISVIAVFYNGITLGARDDSLRCGSNLISLKDTMYEVRMSCGEPFTDRIIGEKTSYRLYNHKRIGVESVIYITEWVYERSDGIYVLTFEGSRLVGKEFIFQ